MTVITSDGGKLARNGRKTTIYILCVSQVQKNIFPAFCFITFEPIEVQTRSAPQNDSGNLSSVKYIHVDGGKLARNGQKTAILVGTWGRLTINDEYAALL